MGPGHDSSSNEGSKWSPSRPKFSGHVRNVPWTYGQGDQSGYAGSVKLWKKLHATFPKTNPNKLDDNVQGIMLQSALYARGVDLCKLISEEVICWALNP